MEAYQHRITSCLLVVAFATVVPTESRAVGPDIIVGDVAGANDILRYGTVNGIAAYAIRTTACNIGDSEAAWYSQTNQHPVIAQNLYRLKDGQFRQIGMSWLKHGFATENDEIPGCGTCVPTDGDTLGVGCADTYSAQLNGIQQFLGPRSQVNPSTGFFPFPFTAPPAPVFIGRRLQVRESDLDPVKNSGARYFIEAQYVSADDAFFGNSANNASYREVVVSPEPVQGFKLTPTGSTVRELPGIFAWQSEEPAVKLTQVVVENDGGPGYRGYFWVAARATYQGNCRWKYDYAVQNLNSHQACREFAVQIPQGTDTSSMYMSNVRYHSGENANPFHWWREATETQIRWFANMPGHANTQLIPLYWSTIYNFGFEADGPPTCEATASLGLFRTPGAPPLLVQTIGPGVGDPCSGKEPFVFSCE